MMFFISLLICGSIYSFDGNSSQQYEISLHRQQIFRVNPVKRYRVEIFFPEVLGRSDVSHRANLGIQSITTQAITEFQNAATHLSHPDDINRLCMEYHQYWNSFGLLSIHFTKIIFLSGATPDTIQNTFNYCMKDKRQLKFDDVFTDRQSVANVIRNLLPKKASFGRQALDYFVMNGDGVYFCFNNGHFDTSNCPNQVFISWAGLKPYVRRTFTCFSF